MVDGAAVSSRRYTTVAPLSDTTKPFRRSVPSVAAVIARGSFARSLTKTSVPLPGTSSARNTRNGSVPTKTAAVATVDAALVSVMRYLKRVTPLKPPGRPLSRTVESALTLAVPTSGAPSMETVSLSPSASLSFESTLMLSSAAPSARITSFAATGA